MFGELNGTHQKLAGIVGRDIRGTGATGAAALPPPPYYFTTLTILRAMCELRNVINESELIVVGCHLSF